MRLVVVGFGLIGASVALAARRGGDVHVTAADRRAVIEQPAARAAADGLLDVADEVALAEEMAAADLVVLAAPVLAIVDLLKPALASGANVVSDCGSTKGAILEAAREANRSNRFVGGHPMAGLPHGGAAHASAELFQGRPWILCPEGADSDAVDTMRRFVESVGAKRVELSAEDHDRAVAMTSHVPQLLASAILEAVERRSAEGAGGPAFERLTHGAGGAESMWADIFQTNAFEIARALADLTAELEAVRRGLEAEPPDLRPALELLARARKG